MLVFASKNTGKAEERFTYYEYKYLVPHANLEQVTQILNELHGHSDPFPCGIVDSIYYDSFKEDCYAQCLNGNENKIKYRIRGYGDGNYLQVHQKIKNLASVDKYKSKIKLVQAKREIAPLWEDLEPLEENENFSHIRFNSSKHGVLFPSVRIKYYRHRFRSYDYRITLDTNVEAFAPINGLPRKISYAILPDHVLEIKTKNDRPVLPFAGLVQLRQVSFSKFMLGLNLLKGEL